MGTAAHDLTANVKCMLVNVKHSFDKYAAYNQEAESSLQKCINCAMYK